MGGVVTLVAAAAVMLAGGPRAVACDRACTVQAAIVALQPAASQARAEGLSAAFLTAADEAGLDPLLLVAIAMRESSLREDIERLERMGSVGEIGLMQVHPQGPALRFRPSSCPSTLEGAECQIRTGARYLAFVRDQCGGGPWRWVAAYGMSRCPSEHEGEQDQSTRRAHNYYVRVGGTQWP